MKLHLDIFEGPLDLLLYLIKKNNLEISRISLSQVTAQYLVYLNTMQELDIDLASDFLYMAAELAHLKSSALLPRAETSDDEELEEDRADELVRKLRLYQHFKELAGELYRRPLLHRDVFTRGSFPDFEEAGTESKTAAVERVVADEYDVSSYELVRAFTEVLKKLPQEQHEHRVAVERVSITERIYEIVDLLNLSESLLFTDLFAGQMEKVDLVVTFLAILEMAKIGMLHVYQPENFGPIRLQSRLQAVAQEELQQHIQEDLGEKT